MWDYCRFLQRENDSSYSVFAVPNALQSDGSAIDSMIEVSCSFNFEFVETAFVLTTVARYH